MSSATCSNTMPDHTAAVVGAQNYQTRHRDEGSPIRFPFLVKKARFWLKSMPAPTVSPPVSVNDG